MALLHRQRRRRCHSSCLFLELSSAVTEPLFLDYLLHSLVFLVMARSLYGIRTSTEYSTHAFSLRRPGDCNGTSTYSSTFCCTSDYVASRIFLVVLLRGDLGICVAIPGRFLHSATVAPRGSGKMATSTTGSAQVSEPLLLPPSAMTGWSPIGGSSASVGESSARSHLAVAPRVR